MELDEFDLALIEQLRIDGRASFESLGAQAGLSRTAARARVQRIFESGALRVVAMVHPEIDGIHAFGHVSIAVHGRATAQVAASVAQFPDTPLVSIVSGRHSIVAELRSSDVANLADTVSLIRSVEGVQFVDTLLYTHLVKESHAPAAHEPESLDQFDDTDRLLLNLLRQDGRMPYADLAERVGLSRGATRTRVLRLIESGVVAITGIVDPTAFGMTQMTGFQLHLETDGETALSEIGRIGEVDFLARTLGRCDAVGTLITRTRAETIDILDRMRAIDGVRDLQSWTHLELVKEQYDRRPLRALPRSGAAARG
ncbi:Lrp/AsnC family transcriptional regulator (plasmid) [Streptomyces sp. HUAS 31]|uniref:Lrp/AsnC family transcriptional regulator n=1 Tax=Streptomyces TaxID=1883 RepID=UPI002305D4A8|nr:Lrp/AsnC family transcriptional regulator [Streptomyces sp. HUAS 31]WCE02476.1 Lrp/AsnC family transcriptional regulator [Streptomyces sp. HUAS 31]